jgi:hypothetical protein
MVELPCDSSEFEASLPIAEDLPQIRVSVGKGKTYNTAVAVGTSSTRPVRGAA